MDLEVLQKLFTTLDQKYDFVIEAGSTFEIACADLGSALIECQKIISVCVERSQTELERVVYLLMNAAAFLRQTKKVITIPQLDSLGVQFFAKVDAVLTDLKTEVDRLEKLIQQLSDEDLKKLELERQLKVNQFPLEMHLKAMLACVDGIKDGKLQVVLDDQIKSLYEELQDKLAVVGLQKLPQTFERVKQLDELEAVCNKYVEMLQRVREDATLDEEEREEQIAFLEQRRDSDLKKLTG